MNRIVKQRLAVRRERHAPHHAVQRSCSGVESIARRPFRKPERVDQLEQKVLAVARVGRLHVDRGLRGVDLRQRRPAPPAQPAEAVVIGAGLDLEGRRVGRSRAGRFRARTAPGARADRRSRGRAGRRRRCAAAAALPVAHSARDAPPISLPPRTPPACAVSRPLRRRSALAAHHRAPWPRQASRHAPVGLARSACRRMRAAVPHAAQRLHARGFARQGRQILDLMHTRFEIELDELLGISTQRRIAFRSPVGAGRRASGRPAGAESPRRALPERRAHPRYRSRHPAPDTTARTRALPARRSRGAGRAARRRRRWRSPRRAAPRRPSGSRRGWTTRSTCAPLRARAARRKRCAPAARASPAPAGRARG